MSERQILFGAETEYALVAMSGDSALGLENVLYPMMRLAREQLVHLPDVGSGGMFLSNGARLYIDCGQHPEMSSPECADPWTLVRYIKAGHRILADLARAVESQNAAGAKVMCFLCNVDYSGSLSTWGSHESYLHRMNPASLQPQIIPHLVSRIVITGAGGFKPMSPGLEFTLSPRAAFINRVASSESTCERGIFHTKNEPLSQEGFNRLHVLCGESLCSETAMLLKYGASALVVAMAEAGLNPGSDMQLESPLDALRCFAADVTCKKTVRIKGGRRVTAVEIQRHYLQMAEANLHHACMPSWAGEVCQLWRKVLDLLETDPQSTQRMLDWSLKLALYSNEAAKLDVSWNRLGFWNEVLGHLRVALQSEEYDFAEFALDFFVGPQSPIPGEVERLNKLLLARQLHWDELRRLLKNKQRFYELDTRFGQLGPAGIFESLDATGVLDHRLEGIGDITVAMSDPPPTGRARVRGNAIRRLTAEHDQWICDWQGIFHAADTRTLDLSNPFATEEKWRTGNELDPAVSLISERRRIFSFLENRRRRA